MPSLALTSRAAVIMENLLKHKWSHTILRHLCEGVTDPVEITRIEQEIVPSTMSERLRTMVRHHLIQRADKYPRAKAVQYRLTPRGRRVLTVLDLISQLDLVSDSDPRSLEEIFHLDLRMRAPAPLLLTETEPSAAAHPSPSRKKTSEQLIVS